MVIPPQSSGAAASESSSSGIENMKRLPIRTTSANPPFRPTQVAIAAGLWVFILADGDPFGQRCCQPRIHVA